MWNVIKKTVSHSYEAWKRAKIISTDEGITIGEVFDKALFEVYGRD